MTPAVILKGATPQIVHRVSLRSGAPNSVPPDLSACRTTHAMCVGLVTVRMTKTTHQGWQGRTDATTLQTSTGQLLPTDELAV